MEGSTTTARYADEAIDKLDAIKDKIDRGVLSGETGPVSTELGEIRGLVVQMRDEYAGGNGAREQTQEPDTS